MIKTIENSQNTLFLSVIAKKHNLNIPQMQAANKVLIVVQKLSRKQRTSNHKW